MLHFLHRDPTPSTSPPKNSTQHIQGHDLALENCPYGDQISIMRVASEDAKGYVRAYERSFTRGSSIIYHPPNPTPFTNTINTDRSPRNKIYRPTYGRYLQSKLIRPEMEFCMQTDAHMDVGHTFLC